MQAIERRPKYRKSFFKVQTRSRSMYVAAATVSLKDLQQPKIHKPDKVIEKTIFGPKNEMNVV